MADRSDKPRAGTAKPRAGTAKPSPHHAARAQAEKAARQARLAAEMRNNLLKRKRQQRARDGQPPRD